MNTQEKQLQIIESFGLRAHLVPSMYRIDIINGYVGNGVSLITENNEFKLSITGHWVGLIDAIAQHQALGIGIKILQQLREVV